jgi:3D-(3,5/4)-trihydroxycyclohexane-1,2-dione acylhydrolase (decyclizing)
MRNRLGALVCTSSIGPGATNMITGAAVATVNRLPVLLLPGDVFAGHGSDPVLQQLEVPSAGDVSVNDCFRPVSRYFDRISRPAQVIPAALAAMRVLDERSRPAWSRSRSRRTSRPRHSITPRLLRGAGLHVLRQPPGPPR